MSEQESVAKLNLYDLIILLVKWRKLFIVNFLLVALIAVVMALTLPVWYSATTTILPPSGGGGGRPAPSFLPSDLKGVAANFGLEIPTDDIYQTIFSSRTLKERIINRFNLREVYKMDDDVFLEDVVAALETHLNIVIRDDDAIDIVVEDQDPERAAAIANACVEELDQRYREITSNTAHNNRTFIEKRLTQVNDSMAFLQDSLTSFQERTKAISISDQVLAMINAAADLKARQISIEIEADVMQINLGEDHPVVAQLRTASREFNYQYESMLAGSEGNFFLSLKELPKISRQYADILRQLRIQSTLVEFMYPQYENAKIQEERETANVQVLDKARVPMRKSRPPRKVIVIIASLASFIVTLILVVLIEYWNHLPEKNPEDWRKVQQIFKPLGRGKK